MVVDPLAVAARTLAWDGPNRPQVQISGELPNLVVVVGINAAADDQEVTLLRVVVLADSGQELLREPMVHDPAAPDRMVARLRVPDHDGLLRIGVISQGHPVRTAEVEAAVATVEHLLLECWAVVRSAEALMTALEDQVQASVATTVIQANQALVDADAAIVTTADSELVATTRHRLELARRLRDTSKLGSPTNRALRPLLAELGLSVDLDAVHDLREVLVDRDDPA